MSYYYFYLKEKKKAKLFQFFLILFCDLNSFFPSILLWCACKRHMCTFLKKKKYNVGLVHGCLTPVIKENKIKSPLCWHKIPTKIIFNKKWFQEKWFFFFFFGGCNPKNDVPITMAVAMGKPSGGKQYVVPQKN